jgi:predicted DNA-binding helix-hairpin-helix protein
MNMKRVYYSGYVPISTDSRLPALGSPVPVMRENRLYQADWLMRFYGFKVDEIVNPDYPLLDLEIDPKLGWALRNPDLFPVDINFADAELIKRIPGIGLKGVGKILKARKFTNLNFDHLKKIGIAINRAKYFISAAGDFERKVYSQPQLKRIIVGEMKSKYAPNFSTQMQLFL